MFELGGKERFTRVGLPFTDCTASIAKITIINILLSRMRGEKESSDARVSDPERETKDMAGAASLCVFACL